MKITIFTESEYKKAKVHLEKLLKNFDYGMSGKFIEEIKSLGVAIEDYEKIHYPIPEVDPVVDLVLLERSKRRWEHEANGDGKTFSPRSFREQNVPEWKYYVFNPNTGEFVDGPFACKNVANSVRRDKTPKAGAPENEPYVVVELHKDYIMAKKVDYRRGVDRGPV